MRGGLIAICVAGMAAPAASGPGVFLVPDACAVRAGERVRLRIAAADGGGLRGMPWPGGRVEWLGIRAAGTQENLDQATPEQPGEDFITRVLVRPGVTMIGLDLRPAMREWGPGELDGQLRPLGLEGRPVVRPGAGRVRVRLVESAKALVRVRGAVGQREPDSAAMSKSGQAVEIRPLADPTIAAVGADVPLRVYVGGEAREGAAVTATHVASGARQRMTTGSAGACPLRLTDGGVWRVTAAWVEPAAGDDCDLVIYVATLTFENGAAGGRR